MKQEKKILPSQVIKTFLDFVDNARSDYNYNLEAMKTDNGLSVMAEVS